MVAKWYILHTVSGSEKGVKKMIEDQVIKKKMSDYFASLNADLETKKRLEDSGFVLVDIPLAKIPAFMKEKTPLAMDDAKNAGMIK